MNGFPELIQHVQIVLSMFRALNNYLFYLLHQKSPESTLIFQVFESVILVSTVNCPDIYCYKMCFLCSIKKIISVNLFTQLLHAILS